MVLARRSARKAIEAKLKGQGVRVSFVPPCEIMTLTNDYLAKHRAFFVVEAKQAIATRRGFKRWRLPDCVNVKINAQTEKQPISTTSSTTSVVQKLGAK